MRYPGQIFSYFLRLFLYLEVPFIIWQYVHFMIYICDSGQSPMQILCTWSLSEGGILRILT